MLIRLCDLLELRMVTLFWPKGLRLADAGEVAALMREMEDVQSILMPFWPMNGLHK